MSDSIYTDEEMEQAEKSAETILCIKCNISKDEKDCSSCEDLMKLKDSHLKQAKMDKITTEMMEFICSSLCRTPRELGQEEAESACAECKMGRFVCDILNNN